MPRYKLTLEYAGTRYSGWQIQKNARTVQGEVERAIREVVRSGHVETYGSGRTDAGVHALAQVAHVDLGVTLPPATLIARVNDALPHDINVLSAERVPARFHARHSAVARRYLYQIALRRTAFAKPFVWWVKEPLALERMQTAAASLRWPPEGARRHPASKRRVIVELLPRMRRWQGPRAIPSGRRERGRHTC